MIFLVKKIYAYPQYDLLSKFLFAQEFIKSDFPEIDSRVKNLGRSGYGYDLVGHAPASKFNCGHFIGFKGCIRGDLHDFTDLNIITHTGTGHIRKKHVWCHNPSCRVCYFYGWVLRSAFNINKRLMTGIKMGLGDVEHIVCSIPKSDYGLVYSKLRSKVVKVLKSRGVHGGALVFHAFRYKDSVWVFEPHFHVLGFVYGSVRKCRRCSFRLKNRCCKLGCSGIYARCGSLSKLDGYVVKVLAERKSVLKTLFYQLSHASVRVGVKRFHPYTYFGTVSYRKLKVDKNKGKFVAKCCICGSPMVDLDYVGSLESKPITSSGHDLYKKNEIVYNLSDWRESKIDL